MAPNSTPRGIYLRVERLRKLQTILVDLLLPGFSIVQYRYRYLARCTKVRPPFSVTQS